MLSFLCPFWSFLWCYTCNLHKIIYRHKQEYYKLHGKAIYSIPESIIIVLLYYSVKGTPPNLSPCFLVISECIIMSSQMFCLQCQAKPQVLHELAKYSTTEHYYQPLGSFIKGSKRISVSPESLISLLRINLNGLHQLYLSRMY